MRPGPPLNLQACLLLRTGVTLPVPGVEGGQNEHLPLTQSLQTSAILWANHHCRTGRTICGSSYQAISSAHRLCDTGRGQPHTLPCTLLSQAPSPGAMRPSLQDPRNQSRSSGLGRWTCPFPLRIRHRSSKSSWQERTQTPNGRASARRGGTLAVVTPSV